MRVPIDVVASLSMGACCVGLLAAHARFGRTRYQRVQQQGATFFLGLDLMNAGYWALQPIVRRCVARGVSADTISWVSLVPAAIAAVLTATGHWGFAAWALLASALMDVMDGAVARASGTMSASGAVLDSVLDRYAEAIVFGGIFYFYRTHVTAQLVTMAALVGSFLITYSTAKAEALRAKPPRGSMKRSDRLTLLVLGAALTPLSLYWLESPTRAHAWPMLVAITLIAVLANASAIQRFAALAAVVRDARPESSSPRSKATPGKNVARGADKLDVANAALPARTLRSS
jgi:phosphatidylglycerophosphate synthase